MDNAGAEEKTRNASRIILGAFWLIFIFLGSMTIRLSDYRIEAPSDAHYYLETARGLAAGHGYRTVFNHAYSPPLFSSFLALMIRLGCDSIFCLKHATLLAFSFSVLIIYRLCRGLFGYRAGIAGAFLFIIFPWFITLPNYMFSENIFIPLFMLGFVALHRAFEKPSMGRFAFSGLLFGVAALCREITLYIPLLLLIVVLVYRKTLRRPALCFIAFSISLLATVTPWTIRNYMIFGKLVPITTNSWINIYIGNNPKYENIYSFTWTIPDGTNWNIREQADGSDEYETMARSRSEAIKYIVGHPGKFVRRFTLRTWRFITPNFSLIEVLGENMILKTAVAIDLALYSLFGFVFLIYVIKNRGRLFYKDPMLLLSILFILYTIIIAGLTHSVSRFRLPTTLLLLAYSTYFADWLARLKPNIRD